MKGKTLFWTAAVFLGAIGGAGGYIWYFLKQIEKNVKISFYEVTRLSIKKQFIYLNLKISILNEFKAIDLPIKKDVLIVKNGVKIGSFKPPNILEKGITNVFVNFKIANEEGVKIAINGIDEFLKGVNLFVFVEKWGVKKMLKFEI